METQTYNYKVVRQFAVMTVVWGIVGMLVGVIIAAIEEDAHQRLVIAGDRRRCFADRGKLGDEGRGGTRCTERGGAPDESLRESRHGFFLP